MITFFLEQNNLTSEKQMMDKWNVNNLKTISLPFPHSTKNYATKKKYTIQKFFIKKLYIK